MKIKSILSMVRTSILAGLATFIISGCNNSKDTKMATNNKTDSVQSADQGNEKKQDSISSYALINGLKMYYEIHGTGTPLVLIHGGGSTIRTTFGRVLDSFAKKHQVIAVELQAHGHTVDRDKPLSFEQDADDVAALLNYLKIEKADIFGFSNGGNTTMQIAIRHPNLVRKIIIGSAFFKRDGVYPAFWEFIQNATLKVMPQQLQDAYKNVSPNPGDLNKFHDKCKQRMVEFKDWKAADIHSINAPALIIIGDADMVRPEHAVEMMRLLPHGRLSIITGGHGAYIGEITTGMEHSKIPGLTVSMIEEFLNEAMPE